MDPITLIVTALAAGAAAGLGDTAAQAVKDAYAGLKSLIVGKVAQAAPGVEQLEAAPDSKARRAVVEEDLAKASVGQDPEVLRQAKALLDAIQAHDPDAARTIGIDLANIKGASLKLADIIASGAGPVTGVQVKDADIAGDIVITGVRAGSQAAAADPAPAAPAKIKILFLAANPRDTTRLRLGEEVRGIDESLRLAEYRDAFDLEQAHAVRVSDLQGLLLRCEPHIVHFSGHGSSEGEIILEDESGQTQAVPARALSTAFALLKDNIRCVVLNACYSEIQAKAIAESIDCVVGMSTAIGDQAAIEFASAFYQALGYGRSVRTAFDLGCNQIDLASLGEQDTPQLLAPHVDASQVTFARR